MSDLELPLWKYFGKMEQPILCSTKYVTKLFSEINWMAYNILDYIMTSHKEVRKKSLFVWVNHCWLFWQDAKKEINIKKKWPICEKFWQVTEVQKLVEVKDAIKDIDNLYF
jgi:hypothetical protein